MEGIPEPNIFWEKDGRILSHSSDFTTEFDGRKAKLSIRRVYPEDEGEYTCVVSNNIGRSYSSACIIVDGEFSDFAFRMSLKLNVLPFLFAVPEEKENLLSRQLSRPCGLLSANSTPISTPRSTPVRSMSPLHTSHRSNSSSYHPKRHKYAAPKFYSVPHNRVVEEGESVQFQCAIAGHPPPWSTWDKEGIIVTPATRITIKERDDLRILEIDEVSMEDAGLYRITLENDYGRIEATARLDVIKSKSGISKGIRTESAPSRRSWSSSRRIMGYSTSIGGRMALSCQYRSSSIPSKKVFHNGREVFDSDRMEVNISNTMCSLVIQKAEIADAGEYTLILENEMGMLSMTTTMAVLEEEDEVIERPPRLVTLLAPSIEAREGQPLDLTFEVDSTLPFNYYWMRDEENVLDTDDFV